MAPWCTCDPGEGRDGKPEAAHTGPGGSRPALRNWAALETGRRRRPWVLGPEGTTAWGEVPGRQDSETSRGSVSREKCRRRRGEGGEVGQVRETAAQLGFWTGTEEAELRLRVRP